MEQLDSIESSHNSVNAENAENFLNNNFDNNIEDPSEEQDLPLSRYSITSYGADYPVDGLVKRINREDIYIPKFQRSFVWKIDQASRFIESLLFGLPVPGIFLAKENETNKLIVIDGQQRLRTLQFFYNGVFNPQAETGSGIPFELKKVAEQFEGKTYKNLDEDDRRMLDDSILPATIVRQDEPKPEPGHLEYQSEQPSSIYHLFERLNTGGSKLLPQEIRACIIYGEFNDCLGELNQNILWQKIFQSSASATQPDPKQRMKDVELILRFLSLFLDLDNYKGSMKDFLNTFMKKNRNLRIHGKDYLIRLFESSISTVYHAIGIKAFRPRRGLNAAVFDAVMVGISRRLEQGQIQSLSGLKKVYDSLVKDEKFLEVSINARQISSPKNVITRIELATSAFANLT